MKAVKWIGGILGFMSYGPLGALAGVVIGAIFDEALSMGDDRIESNNQAAANAEKGTQYSFRFALLVLASYIIRADGKVMHSEMEYVRMFLRQVFGADAEKEGNEILLRIFEERKRMEREDPQSFRVMIRQCAMQVAEAIAPEQRLQLLAFLCGIAKADGVVCDSEVAALKELSRYMGLNESEVDSILNLGGSSIEEAYKVLEITPDATDAEVRTAYRNMVRKHHPDKVQTLGEDVKRAAEEKMQRINEARDRIYQARGMK
jgi:DnaJ like chaperone protein